MKMRSIILSIAIILFFLGCKKKESGSTTTELPAGLYIKAIKNTTDWTALPTDIRWGADTIAIQGSSNADVLNIKFKFNGPGQYTLPSNQQNYYYIFGEVVIKSKYALRTDVLSTITIKYYDAQNRIIRGIFNLRMVKVSDTTNSEPQYIDFVNGKFSIQ